MRIEISVGIEEEGILAISKDDDADYTLDITDNEGRQTLWMLSEKEVDEMLRAIQIVRNTKV